MTRPSTDRATPNAEVAQQLYGASETQRDLYPLEVPLRQIFQNRDEEVATVLGLDAAARQERQNSFTTMIRNTGLDPYHVGKLLYDLVTDADLADVRREEHDGAVQNRWNQESRERLQTLYGRDEAEALIKRVQTFAATQPALNKLLLRRGIGSRPEVVEALIEHVRGRNIR